MKQQSVIGLWAYDGVFAVDKFKDLKAALRLPSLLCSFWALKRITMPVKLLQWKTGVFWDLWSEHESLASCYWEINISLPNICWQWPNNWMSADRISGKEMTSESKVWSFLLQSTQLKWGFLHSFCCKILQSYPLVLSLINYLRTTGGKSNS